MKIPLEWLKEYVPVSLSAKALADRLTMTGTAIERVESVHGSDVLDAEITTNRPDCLSMTGMAHEVSAVTGKKIKTSKRPAIKFPTKNTLELDVTIEDKKACPLYTAVGLTDARIAPSPRWMTDRLVWSGKNPISNAVDLTNFCLFEIGQPLHAFDYDKVRGKKIIVRRARKGEKIVGLDDIEYSLDETVLVIADAERPIAIAGVMGGRDTGISNTTKRIVLESARFDAITVRRTARKLKISTDSSYRFERGIDPNKVVEGSDRALGLLMDLCGAVLATKRIAAGNSPVAKTLWIELKQERLERVLGAKVSMTQASKILKALGFKLQVSASRLKVQTTSARTDIREEADLIEEVVRIHGFDKIPTVIPATRNKLGGEVTSEYTKIRRIKESLAAQGLWEAVTFSLVSGDVLKKIKYPSDKKLVKIENPLSAEQEYLAPSALPGMLESLAHNVNRKEKDLEFFEVSKRFVDGTEKNILSIAITGESLETWETKGRNSIYRLKGIVENVFALMKKPLPRWEEAAVNGAFSEAIHISIAGMSAGFCAAVDAQVLNAWKIADPVYYAEVELDLLFDLESRSVFFQELPKYPLVRRDIAFLIDKSISVGRIEEIIRYAGDDMIQDVTLFDQYTGKNIPKEKRSLAFSLHYQKTDGTFTDDEITLLHGRIVSALKSDFRIELR